MLFGAGFAHNYSLVAKGAFSIHAVVVGLIFCLLIGFTMREKFE